MSEKSEKSLAHHYKVLKQFLDISEDRGPKAKPSSRAAKAREKLLKLSEGQFRELSTDVYDELKRRIDESRGQPDYLLPKSSFHPKRNQARQKLSSLPQTRFKDLVGDISYEIERRDLHVEPVHDTVPSVIDDDKENDLSPQKYNEKSIDESNISKTSSEIPNNQAMGISSKMVVPTKATLTWSSDEEEAEPEEEEIVTKDNIKSLANDFDDDANGIKSNDVSQFNGSIDHSNSQKEIDELNNKLKEKDIEFNQLKLTLEKVQEELDQNLDKNYELTKQIQLFEDERKQWESSKLEYTSQIDKLQDKTEYNNLMKEFEQIKSANVALRLENQSLKNSASASYKEHSRSNSSGIVLNREPSITSNAVNSAAVGTAAIGGGVIGAVGSAVAEKDSKDTKEGLNSQMSLFLEKLSNLDAAPISEKKPSFIQLRDDVMKWQQKYEDVKTDKFIKDYNTNLLSQSQLKGFVSDKGLIPLNLVGKLHSICETFLVYLDGKDFNSDILFDKISKLSIVANEIANHGDGIHLNSNDLSVQVRDCASHLLTITRYYTIYSNLLPKLVVERAMNDLIFATCELIGKCKITKNELIDEKALNSNSVPIQQSQLKPPVNNIKSSSVSELNSDTDGSELGVRPLRMAKKLQTNSSASIDSFHSTRDTNLNNLKPEPVTTSTGGRFDALGSKLQRLTDSLNNTITESQRTTPTKKSNILDRVKQFESPPQENSNNKSRNSFGSPNESRGSSFVLNRSSLEIKKSPNPNKLDREDPDISIGSIGSTSSDLNNVSSNSTVKDDHTQTKKGIPSEAVDASGAAASGAAGAAAGTYVARNNSKSRGIFQSIRDRFTDPSKEEPVVATAEENYASDQGKHDTSNDYIQTSTAETTPHKDDSIDVDVSPNKSFQSIRDKLADRPPSPSASESTIKNFSNDLESKMDKFNDTKVTNDNHEYDTSLNKAKVIDENSDALNSLNGASKKNVMISEASPEQIKPSNNEFDEEDEETDSQEEGEEDAKTAKARERQEYRKSMAAATFNVDLFDIDDPDNTLTQVLLYLEHQTVEVINTIQILLTAIKKPNATRGDLRDKSQAITEVISQMTEATNTSMNQTRNAQLKEHGSWVVKSLEDCYHRMNILCKPSTDKEDLEFADRSFKQRLAGISFDIAKCTKELVKTVEEASLKEDIANLDARLSHGDDLL